MKEPKKSGVKRLGDFLAGKGFYIVLFLCVAAIGISGYFLLTTPTGELEPVAGATQLTVTPPPTAAPSPSASLTPSASPTAAPSPTPAPTPKATPTPTPAPTPTPTPKPAALVFTWPLKGEVLADYSLEVLAYDETMGDWRTHSGVDIAGELGSQVLAAADGTVSQVMDHPLMGTMVTIDHGQGLTSTYANLAARPTVEEGDSVTTGMVIGAVGDTAAAESGRAAHLHLEMTQDGEPVDPVSLLPQLP